MDKFDLKKYLAEGRLFEETQKVELNTSFLENKNDLENIIDGDFTSWDPKFKNGIKSTEQNFKSSGKPAIPTQRYVYDMVDDDGNILPHINVKFKKPLNEVFIDLDDYDPGEFGVEDFDRFDEIVESKSNPTLQDVSELININNDNFSFYGSYVLEIKPNEILSITKHS